MSEKPEKCADQFLPDWGGIQCELPKEHEGNHEFHGVRFWLCWWNAGKNPQKLENARL